MRKNGKTSNHGRRLLALLLALLLFPSLPSLSLHSAALPSNDPSVSDWNISSDGGNVTLAFSGKAENPWYLGGGIPVTFEDGTAGTLWFSVKAADSTGESSFTINTPYSNTPVETAVDGQADGTYTATITIPPEVLGGKNFTLDFAGTTVSSADISGYTPASPEVTPSPEASAEPTEEPTAEPSVSPEASVAPIAEPLTPNAKGKIVVDGDLSDWAGISGIVPTDPGMSEQVNEWKVARDANGNLYFAMDGNAVSQWDSFDWKQGYALEITQNGKVEYIPIANLGNISGSEVKSVNKANGNTPGPYYVEAMIPANYFSDPSFIITFVKISQPAENIPVIDGVGVGGEEEPVYNGIVIDGEYKDWDAVTKYPANEPNESTKILDSAAMVFDGDRVYCYLKEQPSMSAAGAGPAHNGQYAITTDLGHKLVFQLTEDGQVNGVAGAEVKHVGSEWEISIPASELPKYKDTINFGLYLPTSSEFFVKDVANLNGQGSGGSFNGIVYDGSYTDWDYYPHTDVDYNTPGTDEEMSDAMGALWSDDKWLYGHFVTSLPDHVNAGGYDMMHGINFLFSGTEFSPMLVEAAEDGTITNVSPDPNFSGSKEFYLVNRAGWGLKVGDKIYDVNGNYFCGKITITAESDNLECEFYLEMETLAKELGCDFKDTECQFIRLGNQWVIYSGAPTGPWLGVILCVLAVLGVLGFRVWKSKKSQAQGTPTP